MAGTLVTGNANNNTGLVSAIVWKNCVASSVTESGFSDMILGFAVHGSDTYVSVISVIPGSGKGTPRYYKNGVPMYYTGNSLGFGSRIFVRSR